MCGIVGTTALLDLEPAVIAQRHRGPDAIGTIEQEGVTLAHCRLAIRDLDPRSDQPFIHGPVVLSYAGELWNAEQLRAELPGPWLTTGDTEVVAAALDEWGKDALARMDGMWAVAWTIGDGRLRAATDRYGEIPLHLGRTADGFPVVSTELRGLRAVEAHHVAQVEPGSVLTAVGSDVSAERWYLPSIDPVRDDPDEAAVELRRRVSAGVSVRAVADVPVAALISGGLDSTIVVALAREIVPDLVCYTAVLDERSPDLRHARLVADALGVKLVEVRVEPPTADDLAGVVGEIEQPYKAQVEIGWACLALAEAVRADGHKVVYSGEGADELFASYGFAYHGVKKLGWHAYRRQLFLDQHRKNFARTNKVFLARGVEPRLPFLHRDVVEYALRLSEASCGPKPKDVLRRAFADVVPAEVSRRPKMAFQDAAGIKQAAASAVASPKSFYRAEYERLLG